MASRPATNPPRPKHNYMRPIGSKSDGKTLQLVQRGTDKRIPVELVKQPSGEVLDPAELEGLHVMVSSESGMGIATIPYSVEDGKLVVEVTADISRQLGLGVYTMTATGRIPDPAYADGYHDYEIVVDLCKVTKYGSNETPVKVQANVLEGLKGDTGLSAYELAVRDGYQGTLQEWLKSLVGKDGADAYEVAKKAGYIGSREEWLKTLIGATGLSAYELAKSEGYEGSLTEWLASLKGEKGDSAYEVAVSEGYTGDKQAWLASIKGEKGDNAYTSYLATTTDSTPMTEKQWSNANDFFYQFLFRILNGAGVKPTEIDMTADQVYELERWRVEMAKALRSYGEDVKDTDGIAKFVEIINRGLVPTLTIYKKDQYYSSKDRIIPPLKIWGGWSTPTLSDAFAQSFELERMPKIESIERVVSIYRMCKGNAKLKGGIEIGDTPLCTSAASAFEGCARLESAKLGDMPECTTFDDCFRGCESLLSASVGALKKVAVVAGMFRGCSRLSTVTFGELSSNPTADYMFFGCGALETVNGELSINVVGNSFNGCNSLRDIKLKEVGVDVNLQWCTNLSLESIRYLVEHAKTVTGKVIILSSALLENYENELAEIGEKATQKGWTINYR